jgi:hypothetical protein
LDSCTGCPSSFGGPTFFPNSVNGVRGDMITFSDSNGTGYPYMFPLGSFSKSGTYRTVTQGSTGILAVEVTDDLSVLNSAGYGFCGPGAGILCMTNHIAPGEAATVFGSDNMAGATPAVTVVDAKGVPRLAQLSYVSPAQINFVVPPETTPGTATIIVAKWYSAKLSDCEHSICRAGDLHRQRQRCRRSCGSNNESAGRWLVCERGGCQLGCGGAVVGCQARRYWLGPCVPHTLRHWNPQSCWSPASRMLVPRPTYHTPGHLRRSAWPVRWP